MSSTGRQDEIPALEAELHANPDSLDLHLRLLEAHCMAPELLGTRRRIELVEWLVRNHPDHQLCRTPFCAVNPSQDPEGFRSVKAAWLDAMADAPNNVLILRGAGAFLCIDDYQAAKGLFLKAVNLAPQDAEAWLDLGRLCREPEEQLRAFIRARDLGSESPNLLAWLAQTAIAAGDLDAAETFGRELLDRVEVRRREVGEALQWRERGAQLWKRARAMSGTDENAQKIVRAVSESSHDTHWGNTVLGVVACRRGALDTAAAHLVGAFEITPDYRLGAYGPKPILLQELCRAGRAPDVLKVLKTYEGLWEGEVAARWRQWAAQIERGELPD
ncbi:MAG TPA: hypothetical protein VGK67_14300 [Myxococcales bacterium]